MKGKAKLLILLIPAVLVLTAAAGVQLWDATFHPVVVTKKAPLDSLIPRDIPGWTYEELPLAQTEEVRGRVIDILNFSDHVSRRYLRGNREFILYVAYWEPLQMPVRQVSFHTPDVCWVRNGWECQSMDSSPCLRLNGLKLKSPENRVFSVNGNTQHVIFWHLINGKAFKANNDLGMWDRWNIFTDHLLFGLNQKPEQYFIRISSNYPLDQILTDPSIMEVMKALAEETLLTLPEGEKPEDWIRGFST